MGRNTGLASYRSIIFRNFPRSGIPDQFNSWSEYEEYLQTLVDLHCIDDGKKVWWDLRPHPLQLVDGDAETLGRLRQIPVRDRAHAAEQFNLEDPLEIAFDAHTRLLTLQGGCSGGIEIEGAVFR